MLASAALFALLVPAPPKGPEGLMGLGEQLAWLARLLVLSVIAFVLVGRFIARLSLITPPPLEGEIEAGHWRRHSRKVYTSGIMGALLGLTVFGLAGFAIGGVLAAFAEFRDEWGMSFAMSVAAVAGAWGAIWTGRRALWSAVTASSGTTSETGAANTPGEPRDHSS